MKVSKLIKMLKTMPPNAEFVALYDSFCTIDGPHVYLSKGGRVIMTSNLDEATDDEDLPSNKFEYGFRWGAAATAILALGLFLLICSNIHLF